MSGDRFDDWLQTHCETHDELRPCMACRDEAADRAWETYLEEREAKRDAL